MDNINKLPSLIDYDSSKISLINGNIVNWVLDPSRCILLIHDMQQYFLSALSLLTKENLINNCASILSVARTESIPVVYTAQCGNMTVLERGLLKDFWGTGMNREYKNIEIVPQLKPEERDLVLSKWRYSAFHKTSFLDYFKEQNRDQIIICGVYGHIGILATAIEAYSNDIEVFVINDAVVSFSAKHQFDAINYMSQCCARVINTQDVISENY